MSFGEIMLYLQQNSYYGSIIAMCAVVVLYLAVSIVLIVVARKSGFNTCASGMIPVYNLSLGIRAVIKRCKFRKDSKKSLSEEAENIFGEDEEIIF